jgi:hypothetical protein
VNTADAASHSSRRSSIDDAPLPSSSPSADDFFPALIFTLIHARPAHLHLNVAYIALCRYESKLSGGEAAYWYTNLASAIQFIEGCDWKSFSFAATTNAPAAAVAATAGDAVAVASTVAPAEASTSHRKNSSATSAASIAAAEEARLEYERLMARGEALLREQREREAAEAAEAARLAEAEQARKAEAAAAAAAIEAARHQEEAESNAAAAADAVAFMAAAAGDVVTVMPSPPQQPATPAVSAPAVTAAAAAASAPSAPAPLSSAALSHNHGPSSWSSAGLPLPTALPSPCVACLHLSHRRVAARFLDREFDSLRVGELRDVLREYKEMAFLLQGWQDQAAHRDLRNMPLPPRPHRDADDAEGVALSASDAHSAAPSSAHVAGLSAGTGGAAAASVSASAPAAAAAASAAPASAAIPRGWPLTNFLGLGRTK